MIKVNRDLWLRWLSLGWPILLCLIVLIQNRSLFLDSLNLARNIYESSFGELLYPLDYEQSAPLLFLWLSKVVTSILGITETNLRLVPFFSAGLGLYFFARLGSRFYSKGLVVAMTIYMGTLDIFVRYATEYKQYMTDLAVATFLIYFVSRHDRVDNSNLISFALVFTVCIWLSMPSVFVIGSILTYFGIQAWKGRQSWRHWICLVTIVIVNFSLEYFLILQPAMSTSHMQSFHDEFFMNPKLWQSGAISHNLGLVISEIRMVVGKSGIAIGAAILSLILGLWSTWSPPRLDKGHKETRGKGKLLLVISLPILFAFAASVLGKYSVLDRLMLFSLPLVVLWIGLGIQHLLDRWDRGFWSKAGSTVMIFGLFVGYAAKSAIPYAWEGYHREDNRSALLYISDHSSANTAPIICSNLAVSAYDYYNNIDQNYSDLQLGEMIATSASSDLVDLTQTILIDRDQVWILVTHKTESQLEQLIKRIEEVATIKNSYRAKRSIAILAIR